MCRSCRVRTPHHTKVEQVFDVTYQSSQTSVSHGTAQHDGARHMAHNTTQVANLSAQARLARLAPQRCLVSTGSAVLPARLDALTDHWWAAKGVSEWSHFLFMCTRLPATNPK